MTTVDGSFLPLWIRLLPLITLLAVAPIYGLLARLALFHGLRDYRKLMREQPDAHWSQRARLLVGPRGQIVFFLIFMPSILGVGLGYSAGTFSLLPGWALGIAAALVGFFVVYLRASSLGRYLGFRATSRTQGLLSYMYLTHGIPLVLLVAVGMYRLGLLVHAFDWLHLIIALALISPIFLGLHHVFFRLTGTLKRSPELEKKLEPLFQRAGVRPRRLEVLQAVLVNALAYPASQRIVITQGALDVLNDEEVESVIAHELGHLQEGAQALIRWIPIAAFGLAAFSHSAFRLGLLSSFAVILAAVWIPLLVLRRWSRRREGDADHHAHEHSDPLIYASALKKLAEANLYPAVQKGGTHPSLYDRMLKAGVTPDFPRPDPPPRFTGLFSVGLMVIPMILLPHASHLLNFDDAFTQASVDTVLSDDAHPIGELARLSHLNENFRQAASLYRLASDKAPRQMLFPYNESLAWARLGLCAEAEQAYSRAQELYKPSLTSSPGTELPPPPSCE